MMRWWVCIFGIAASSSLSLSLDEHETFTPDARLRRWETISRTAGANQTVRVDKGWVDSWVNLTYFSEGSETPPRAFFYFPEKGTRFSDNVILSIAAVNSPSPKPTSWRSSQSAWMFWQVILEVDYVEVARWGADWISDDSGAVNVTISLPGLSMVPGRHLAIVSVVPGTVTISNCADSSVSPGCPDAAVVEDHGLFDSISFET
mmetsp:Transcript_19018/g.38651  ORF Transcript_19018/g.38651 Transcript_19018/m.38651 type:complete len:204 (-) Transcript_19018:55-666(-)